MSNAYDVLSEIKGNLVKLSFNILSIIFLPNVQRLTFLKQQGFLILFILTA